jgi:hypothetical protein
MTGNTSKDLKTAAFAAGKVVRVTEKAKTKTV